MSLVAAAGQAINASTMNVAQASILRPGAVLGVSDQYAQIRKSIIFRGVIEVEQVNNGYILKIGRTEGAMYDTYIAATIEEINDRIKASMAAFRLEAQ